MKIAHRFIGNYIFDSTPASCGAAIRAPAQGEALRALGITGYSLPAPEGRQSHRCNNCRCSAAPIIYATLSQGSQSLALGLALGAAPQLSAVTNAPAQPVSQVYNSRFIGGFAEATKPESVKRTTDLQRFSGLSVISRPVPGL